MRISATHGLSSRRQAVLAFWSGWRSAAALGARRPCAGLLRAERPLPGNRSGSLSAAARDRAADVLRSVACRRRDRWPAPPVTTRGTRTRPPNELAVQPGGATLTAAGTRAVPSLRYQEYTPPYADLLDNPDGISAPGPGRRLHADGRAATLADQAGIPLLAANEMANGQRRRRRRADRRSAVRRRVSSRRLARTSSPTTTRRSASR